MKKGKGKQYNLTKLKSESDAGKNVRRGDTAIVGGHRSIGVRADRRSARPSENRQDARGARHQGAIPEGVWRKRSCRKRLRHGRKI